MFKIVADWAALLLPNQVASKTNLFLLGHWNLLRPEATTEWLARTRCLWQFHAVFDRRDFPGPWGLVRPVQTRQSRLRLGART
jgi:hypothetical protein